MPNITVSTVSGTERQLEAKTGLTLMEVIRDAGVTELLALCGGACSCATCHVHVDSECWSQLAPMGGDEDELLDSSRHRMPYSRLSCQIRLTEAHDGLRVTVAPED